MNPIKNSPHIPVLLNETIDILDIRKTDIVLDGTIGFGGHSSQILAKLSSGKLIGLDQDPNAIAFCKKSYKNIVLENINFADFAKVLAKHKIKKLDKVLLDLGMSSYQLDSDDRGFSFQGSQPLDMRMNVNNELTGAKILNSYSAEQLIELFKTYGELYRPEKFVSKILEQRPYQTTDELVQTIKKGFFFRNKRHVFMRTCSQVFQALRIEVNQELIVLNKFLDTILDYLNPEARIAIITFHSLEDRIIKNFGKANKFKLKKLTTKVIKPTQTEIEWQPAH